MAGGRLSRPLLRLPLVAGWGAAGLAVSVGLASADASVLLLAWLVVLAGVGVLAIAVAEPRWVLILLLVLLVGYIAETAGPALGLPNGSYKLIVLIAVGLLVRRAFGLEKFVIGPVTLAILALFLVTALSAAFATDRDVGIAELGELARNASVVVLMTMLIDRASWLRRAVWAYVLPAGALAAVAVFQQVTKTYERDYGGFATVQDQGGLIRSEGPLHAVFFGQVLVPAAILALYLAIASPRRSVRLPAFATFGTCLAAIGYTASRGALVAIACGLLLTVLLQPRRTWMPIGALAVTLLLVLPGLSEDYRTRLAAPTAAVVSGSGSASALDDRSLRGRVGENIAAGQMFLDYPVLGVGPGNYPGRYLEYSPAIGLDPRPVERPPHNLLLEALAETGIMGTLALMAVLGLALKGAWTARGALAGRDGVLAEGVFVALVGFLVSGLFLHASTPRYLWVVVGLALATRALVPAPQPSVAR